MVKKPRYFALAQEEDCNDCCGSDSYFLCDGRWNLHTCVEKAKEYYKKLIPKGYYCTFRIYSGTILNANPITELYRVYGENE